MEKLFMLFEDCIRIVREDRPADLSNYYENETLPSRIKTIIRSIEALRQQNGGAGGGDAGMLLVALSKFKDDLSIGAEGIEEMFSDAGLPGVFREAVREIFLLFESKNQQLNSMFDDVFFYKDVIKAVLADKAISEDELAMRENISEDKRKTVALLLKKVEELRHGKAEKGMAGLGELQAQLGSLEEKVEVLKRQHDKDQQRIAETEEKAEKDSAQLRAAEAELERTVAELRNAKSQFKKRREEEERLRGDVEEMRWESELFQSSLALKELDSGRLISEKQAAYEQLKDKDKLIWQMEKSLNEQALELEKAKQELVLAGEAKSKDAEAKLKDAEAKLKDAEGRLKDANARMKESEQREQAMQRRLSEADLALQERESRIRELQEESKNRIEGPVKTEADIELLRRARALIEGAEMFSQIYQDSSERSDHSFISESQIFSSSRENLKLSLSSSRRQEKVELDSFLRKAMDPAALSQIISELPKLPIVEVAYRFPEDKSLTFQERLRGKRNLLLVCRTESGAALGAFSSSGFVKPQKQKNASAFLFCAKDKTALVLRVKEGRSGVVEDEDFLIFGNEELSLEQGCNYATSYFEDSSIRSLHFEGSIDEREEFLRLMDCPSPNSRIPLQRYDILELTASR